MGVIMNYQKFMELVPKETKDFVFTVLDRLNFYENASIFVKIKGLDGYYKKNFITGDEIKILSIMIKILNTTVYSSYSKGFLTRDIYYQNFNDIENELGNIEVFQFEKGSSEATLYKKYIDYFSFLDKEIDYLTLSPLRIFNRALTKIYNETKNIELYLISLQKALEILPNNTKIIEIEKKYLSEIRNNLYEKASIDVIKVVENASIIFQKAKDNFSDYNDLSSITILMSMLLTSSCKEIQSKLSTYEFDIVNKEKYSTFIENEKVDYILVKYYFEKYLKFKNVNELFLALFNRNVTNSVEVEKIFLNAGLTKEKAKSILLTPSKKEIITEFYADTVPKEKGDYQLICSMYNSVNTHNKRLYPNDNMYLTLIAFDYQNNGKLSKYFLENGITLDMILAKYNLELSDSQYIDYQTYLNKVLIGYKDAKDKLKFMASSKFVIDLFNTFAKNKTNNLDSDINNYYKLIEIKETEASYERIYKGKDKIYIDFLNTSYEIYDKLRNLDVVNSILSQTDLKVLSILITLELITLYIPTIDTIKNTVLNENIINEALGDVYNVNFSLYSEVENLININISNGNESTTLKQKINDINHPVEVEKVFGSYLDDDLLNTLYKLFEVEKDNSLILKKLFMGKTIDEIKSNIDNEVIRVATKKKYDEYQKLLCMPNDNACDSTKQLLNKLCMINLTDIKANILYEFVAMNFDNNTLDFYQEALERYGITKEILSEKFGFINSKLAYNEINLENFVALEDYFTTQNNGHKYKNSIQNILINLIADGYFDELITNKKALLYELKETKKYIPSLSETIENLQSIPIEEVNIDSLSEIMKFGDALNGEYELVTSEERKALESDSSALSIQTINDLLSKKNKRKKGFWASLFEPYEEEKTISDVSTLKEAINKNITILSRELLTFDLVRKYISVYFAKNLEYVNKSSEALALLNERLSKLNPKDTFEYASFLEVNSMKTIMTEKNKRFNVTSSLLNQELYKINAAIVNHFITINALEMARDDLIPLIGSEVIIGTGFISNNNAMQITNDVIGLFQAILAQNVEQTKIMLERLNNMPNIDVTKLNANVNGYIEMLEEKNRSLEM
jgi:hypothetical protein